MVQEFDQVLPGRTAGGLDFDESDSIKNVIFITEMRSVEGARWEFDSVETFGGCIVLLVGETSIRRCREIGH